MSRWSDAFCRSSAAAALPGIVAAQGPACPICGTNPTIRELIDYEAFCGIGAEPAYAGPEITVQELEREAAIGKPITVDVREPHEWEIVHLEGAG